MSKGKQATPCKWCGQEGHLSRRCPHKERMVEMDVNAGMYKVTPFWDSRLVAVQIQPTGLKSIWSFVVKQNGRLFLHMEKLHLPAMTLPENMEAEYLIDMYWALRKAAGAAHIQTITDLDNLKFQDWDLYYPLPFEDSLREVEVDTEKVDVVMAYGDDVINVKLTAEGQAGKLHVDPTGQHWCLVYLACELEPHEEEKTEVKPELDEKESSNDLPF
jgi:hypothetical protein